MKKRTVSYHSTPRVARNRWGELSRVTEGCLRDLTVEFSLSVAAGDLQLLNGRWSVTHSGLLQFASRGDAVQAYHLKNLNSFYMLFKKNCRKYFPLLWALEK